jgi:hypothetical protein
VQVGFISRLAAFYFCHRYAGHARKDGKKMLKVAVFCWSIIGVDVALAQDIAGIEDCTKTSGLDKRTGCLQSNINLLHQLVTKNSRDMQQRLNAALNEIIALKSAMTTLQARMEQLPPARKAPSDKKPDAK